MLSNIMETNCAIMSDVLNIKLSRAPLLSSTKLS